MKIPTLLALALLITALTLGILIDKYQKDVKTQLKNAYQPLNVTIVNISENSFSVIWQTTNPTHSQLLYGTTPTSLTETSSDLRQVKKNDRFSSHLITIKNLTPNTKYFFKLKNEDITYPDNPLDAKTAPSLTSKIVGQTISTPIIGSVVDNDLNPVEDSLVILNLPNAQKLATITSTGGNFILPIKDIRNQELSGFTQIEDGQIAQLHISQGELTSITKFRILSSNRHLTGLIFGKNLDLTSLPEEKNQSQNPPSEVISKFDLNADGDVNSLDTSIITQALESKKFDPKFDLNNDQKIDQKDLDLIKTMLK